MVRSKGTTLTNVLLLTLTAEVIVLQLNKTFRALRKGKNISITHNGNGNAQICDAFKQ